MSNIINVLKQSKLEDWLASVLVMIVISVMVIS